MLSRPIDLALRFGQFEDPCLWKKNRCCIGSYLDTFRDFKKNVGARDQRRSAAFSLSTLVRSVPYQCPAARL